MDSSLQGNPAYYTAILVLIHMFLRFTNRLYNTSSMFAEVLKS